MKVRIKDIEDKHDRSYVEREGFVIGNVYEIIETNEKDNGVSIIDGENSCFLYEDEYEVVEV